MAKKTLKYAIKRITPIVGNPNLANSLCESIDRALRFGNIHVKNGQDAWSVFEYSLNVAIRDIENDPRGRLLRRLLEYGPHHPDDPRAEFSDGKTILSDLECATCVEFIFSHMINRFKGELAELLAINPILELLNSLQENGTIPRKVEVFLGDTIQEKRKTSKTNGTSTWSGFGKGADGIITCPISVKPQTSVDVYAVIEIKSMYQSWTKLIRQLQQHVNRMTGGLRLNGVEYPNVTRKMNPVFIAVIPSNWKIDRNYWWEQQGDKRVMHYPDPAKPPVECETEEISRRSWKIKLAWSEEALYQASFEMTYWYMSQIGKAIYSTKPMPQDRQEMTPEDAGYDAIKEKLYYIPLRIKHMCPTRLNKTKLRKFRERIDWKATRLYNVYSFGFARGADSREMLWAEDVLG